MRAVIRYIVFSTVFLCPVPKSAALSAATEPVTTVGPRFDFLRIPTGARSLALGRSGTADCGRALNQQFNPAAIAFLDGVGVEHSRLDWFAGLDFTDLSIHGSWHTGSSDRLRLAGAIGYKKMGRDPPDNRTIFLPDGTGRGLEVNDEQIAVVGTSTITLERYAFAAGVALKRVTTELGGTEAVAWAVDLGVIARRTFGDDSRFAAIPGLALSALHLGRDAEASGLQVKLPRQWRAGAQTRLKAPHATIGGRSAALASLSLHCDYIESEEPARTDVGGGIECGILDALFVRYGRTDRVDIASPSMSSYGFGMAWSVRRFELSADYAHLESVAFFGETQSYGFAVLYRY